MGEQDENGIYHISIHAPAKGATSRKLMCPRLCFISIHAPAKGATLDIIAVDKQPLISIHAPAKGATNDRVLGWLDLKISIHAPAKGATTRHSAFLTRVTDFNPRSREGSYTPYCHTSKFLIISIHAPVKGATRRCFQCGMKQEFQSTLP